MFGLGGTTNFVQLTTYAIVQSFINQGYKTVKNEGRGTGDGVVIVGPN